MTRNHRLFVFFGVLLGGLLIACGDPDEFQSSDRPPSREELIARFRSPADAEELHSFRIRTEASYSGSLFGIEGSDESETGVMSTKADVTTDPRALRITTTIFEDGSEDGPTVDQMIVIDDRIWRNRGDGWAEEEQFLPDMADWLLDSFIEFRNPIAGSGESPEVSDMLREAEIIGTQEIDGHRTTHFRMTTEQMLAMMTEAYEDLVSGDALDRCDDLEALEDDVTEDEVDADALMDVVDCWAGAVQSELPPPSDYIEKFDVDLWISDDGLVLRQTATIVYSAVPFFGNDAERAGKSAARMSTSYELYDLNADIKIEPPVDD